MTTSGIGDRKYAHFEVTTQNNMDIIRINRPAQKNAISITMFKDLITIFDEVSKSDCAITVLTGTGDYFTSGGDMHSIISYFTRGGNIEYMKASLQSLDNPFKDLIDVVIDYPKPLIAVVNGPAIGFGVALLGLCDGVYSTDTATFLTPFTKAGLCMEACSSYTFTRMMGYNLATDLLLFGNKITAVEAHKRGLITKVFSNHSFEKEVWTELSRIAALPKGSMRDSKQIIRDIDRELLHRLNATEMTVNSARLTSEEVKETIKIFKEAKSKI